MSSRSVESPAPAAPQLPLDAESLSGEQLRQSLSLITMAWLFGSVWLTAISGVPTTLFATSLNASPFQFGVLAALPFIASLLSLPASLLIERTGRRKGVFLAFMYTQRLLWIPIALVPIWIYSRGTAGATALAMNVFLVLVFLMHGCQAFGGPAWMSWMADIVPDRVRGRYFSRRRQLGLFSAIPAAWVAGWLLDRYAQGQPPPVVLKWCAIIFLASVVFGLIDIFLFQFVPPLNKKPETGGGLLAAMLEPLKNRQFLFFAGFVGTVIFAISFMGQFVTLYLIEEVGITGQQTQLMLLVVPMAAQLVLFPVWGAAVDRMGKKPVLVLGALGLAPVGIAWCFVTREYAWLGYVLSAAGAALWVGVEMANFNLIMEFSGRGENGQKGGSSYASVNIIIVSIAGLSGGLASGAIAQGLKDLQFAVPLEGFKTLSYFDVLFVLSGLLRLLAVVIFLPFVHEPEARPAVEALRFMSANIYNNLFNAVTQPLRLLGINLKNEQGGEAE